MLISELSVPLKSSVIPLCVCAAALGNVSDCLLTSGGHASHEMDRSVLGAAAADIAATIAAYRERCLHCC
jgi:hypothetical protein